MDEECSNQGPEASGQEVVEAEDQVLVRPVRVLLPRVEACKHAPEDEEPVDAHRSRPWITKSREVGLFQKYPTLERPAMCSR